MFLQPHSVDLAEVLESPYVPKRRPKPVGKSTSSDSDEGKENFLVPETPR